MADFQRGGNRGGGFKGGNRDGGRPSFPKKSFGGDRDNRDVQMHSATCSDCGKRCEVPFRPTGDKPVFCNECFSKKRDGGDDRGEKRGYNEREPRNNFNDRFNNERAPRKDFTPREVPKSYDAPKNNDNSEIKKQLEALNSKIDRLIETLSSKKVESKTTVAAPVRVAPIKKATQPKVIVKIPAKKVATKSKIVAKKVAPKKK